MLKYKAGKAVVGQMLPTYAICTTGASLTLVHASCVFVGSRLASVLQNASFALQLNLQSGLL